MAQRKSKLEVSLTLFSAFSGRMVMLSITLLLEIPIVFMICGGSDRICEVFGRSRYQLFVGILPICTAVSGNVGLQASDFMIRAIAQEQIDRKSYATWILREIGASAHLGLAMGALVGALSILIDGFHLPFVLTIAAAQFFSILWAGLTGCLMPLILSAISTEGVKSWNSALVTAVQDLFGSAFMVVVAFKLGEVFGPMEENGADSCGGRNNI